MRRICFLLAVIFALGWGFTDPVSGYGDNTFSQNPRTRYYRKAILTSDQYDVRVTKIMVRYEKFSKTITQDVGTGFFMTDGGNYIYLVSSGHVFEKALKILLDNPGKVITFQRFVTQDPAGTEKIVPYEIDLVDCWNKGTLKLNKDNDIDVGIVRIRTYQTESKEQKKQKRSARSAKEEEPHYTSYVVDIYDDKSSVLGYENIYKAEEIYFFGFPELSVLSNFNKKHALDPVVRKGIVSKFLDSKKILIEGGILPGTSGSPVFLRREYVSAKGDVQIQLRLIGLISHSVPAAVTATGEFPSGLALVESVNNILFTLQEFSQGQ
ncbi:MAG: hypothetical protein JXD21_08705 [Candidatus Omnitrophica bacterium]|nr:hypothetical protein [Candidatus Omnitrophota bacterium]